MEILWDARTINKLASEVKTLIVAAANVLGQGTASYDSSSVVLGGGKASPRLRFANPFRSS
jgi:hypothetical protein